MLKSKPDRYGVVAVSIGLTAILPRVVGRLSTMPCIIQTHATKANG
jgi:hypothetical protein